MLCNYFDPDRRLNIRSQDAIGAIEQRISWEGLALHWQLQGSGRLGRFRPILPAERRIDPTTTDELPRTLRLYQPLRSSHATACHAGCNASIVSPRPAITVCV